MEGKSPTLAHENTFSEWFYFKTYRKSTGSSKNSTRGYFQNSHPFEISIFFATISEYFERFQHFHFEANFHKIENHFQKSGVLIFS